MGSAEEPIADYLAGTYRQEIDQEEIIWRSLPFFAAVLALELNALFIAVRSFAPSGAWRSTEMALLAIDALAMLVTLGLVTATIFPVRFEYMPKATELREYALALDKYASDPDPESTRIDPAAVLQSKLADYQAQAIDHNRRVNQRRLRWRSFAGLFAMISIFLTISLAFIEVTSDLNVQSDPARKGITAHATQPAPRR